MIGPLIGVLYAPAPPAAKFMGKTPEYTEQYTKCFRDKSKKEQIAGAFTGCLISSAAIVAAGIVYYIIVVSIEHSAQGCLSSSSSGCSSNLDSSCSSGVSKGLGCSNFIGFAAPEAKSMIIPFMP